MNIIISGILVSINFMLNKVRNDNVILLKLITLILFIIMFFW